MYQALVLSTRRISSENCLAGGLLAAAISFATVTKLHRGPETIDDAYITLRYVANLLDGNGFVYNVGERVLGTTSPLYTLMLALVSLATGVRDLPTLSFALNLVVDSANIVVLFLLAGQLRLPAACAAAAAMVYAASASVVYYACAGMETVLFVFWLLSASLAYMRAWDTLAFALGGLAAMTRPEGALLIMAFLALELILAKRLPSRSFVGLIPLVAWIVFAAIYFGSPLPQSVRAKAAAAIYTPYPQFEVFRLLASHASKILGSTSMPSSDDGTTEWILKRSVLLLCFVSAVRFAPSYRSLALPLFVVLFWLGYGLANRILCEWYPVPLEPLYLLMLFAGAYGALAWILPAVKGNAWGRLAAAAFALSIAIPAQLERFVWVGSGGESFRWYAPLGFWPLEGREDVYREAAGIVATIATPEDTVALSEIGAFGYWYPGRILDTVGVVSPVAIRYYPFPEALKATNNAIPPDLIHDLKPEFVASLEIFVRRSLLESEWFSREYELTLSLPTNYFGSKGFLVFRRRTETIPRSP